MQAQLHFVEIKEKETVFILMINAGGITVSNQEIKKNLINVTFVRKLLKTEEV